jgi:hypothetical protein
MALLGLGVGIFSAAMPGTILAVTPAGETSSAMSFNQVGRSVGCSIGSALSGLILSAYTNVGTSGVGERFPISHGYAVAAWAGARGHGRHGRVESSPAAAPPRRATARPAARVNRARAENVFRAAERHEISAAGTCPGARSTVFSATTARSERESGGGRFRAQD